MSDAELVRLWRKQRDARAFHEIVTRYGGLVYGTCKRVLGDAAEAEDVAQECFVYLASRAPRIHTSLPAWLHRLALHRSYDRMKSESRRRRREEAYADAAETKNANSIDDVLDYIDAAVEELPEKHRRVIVDHFFLQKTHAAIAAELGLGRRAVSYRIENAVAQLRDALKRKGVIVPAGTLAGGLAASLSEAAPAHLVTQIGRMALAGAATTRRASLLLYVAQAAQSKAALGITAAALLTAAVLWLGSTRIWEDQAPVPENPAALQAAAAASDPPDTVVAQTSEPAAGRGNATSAGGPSAAPAAATVASSTAPGTIAGRVYDEATDAPIGNAEVTVYRRGGDGEPLCVVTDRDGQYEAADLDAGTYRLRLDRVPGDEEAEERTDEANVALAFDERVESVDFAYRRGLTVSGVVLDPRGRPLANAEVRAYAGNDAGSDSATAGPDGRFELRGFEESPSLFVYAKFEGYAMGPEGPLVLKRPGLRELALQMLPESVVEGTVVDSAGRPVEGVRVAGLPQDVPYSTYPNLSSDPTGPDGRFEIDSIWPGSYLFAFHDHGSHAGSRVSSYEPIEVGEAEAVSDVVLVHQGRGEFTVAGRVVEDDGTPVRSPRIVLTGEGGVWQEFRADGSGRFSRDDLPEGTYSVQASHRAYGDETVSGVQAGTDDLEIVLKRPGGVSGRVVDAASGEPVPAFAIWMAYGWEETVDGAGRFDVRPVPSGMGRLRVKAEGYGEQKSQSIRIEPGETTRDVIVKLTRAERIEGLVVDTAGRPVPDTKIFVNRAPVSAIVRDERYDAQTGPDGTFSIETEPGSVTSLHAHHFRYAPAAVTLADYPERPVRFVLREGGELHGTVRFRGEPMAGVKVAIGEISPAIHEGRTNAEGQYRIFGLGDEIIRPTINPVLEWDGAQLGVKRIESVQMRPGQTVDLDFEFDVWDTAVAGRVTIAGEPPGGRGFAYLVYENSATRYDAVYTYFEDDGTFTLDGARPGPARFEVWIPGRKPEINREDFDGRYTHPVFSGGAVHIREDEPNWIEYDLPEN